MVVLGVNGETRVDFDPTQSTAAALDRPERRYDEHGEPVPFLLRCSDRELARDEAKSFRRFKPQFDTWLKTYSP